VARKVVSLSAVHVGVGNSPRRPSGSQTATGFWTIATGHLLGGLTLMEELKSRVDLGVLTGI